MAKKVRVGIIGSGGIAQGQHMPAYQKDPDVEIVAVCDSNEATAKKAAEQFKVPRIYTDYRELARDKDIDAVSVCTPNFMHEKPTVACLENGKHVMVEKPIARNAKEGAAMVRAAKKNKRILAVGLHMRYSPNVQAIKRFADAGGLGDVYYARIQAIRRRGIPSWGVFGDKEKQGGGPLIDIGVHILYATMYVLDFPKPKAVCGATYTKFGNKPPGPAPWGPWDYKHFTVEDYAAAFIRFEGDLTATLEASFAANTQESWNFWLLGDKGGAQLEPCTFYRDEFGTLTNTTPGWLPKGDEYVSEIRDFLAAVRGEGKPGVTGEQGLMVTQVLDGIYLSAERGAEIKLEALKV